MKILDASSIVCLLKEIDEPIVFDVCETLGHDLYTTKEVYGEIQKNKLRLSNRYVNPLDMYFLGIYS